MCQTELSGYTNVAFEPINFNTYLVKTIEGCYDFALFDINGWSKGKLTDEIPEWWISIPQHN